MPFSCCGSASAAPVLDSSNSARRPEAWMPASSTNSFNTLWKKPTQISCCPRSMTLRSIDSKIRQLLSQTDEVQRMRAFIVAKQAIILYLDPKLSASELPTNFESVKNYLLLMPPSNQVRHRLVYHAFCVIERRISELLPLHCHLADPSAPSSNASDGLQSKLSTLSDSLARPLVFSVNQAVLNQTQFSQPSSTVSIQIPLPPTIPLSSPNNSQIAAIEWDQLESSLKSGTDSSSSSLDGIMVSSSGSEPDISSASSQIKDSCGSSKPVPLHLSSSLQSQSSAGAVSPTSAVSNGSSPSSPLPQPVILTHSSRPPSKPASPRKIPPDEPPDGGRSLAYTVQIHHAVLSTMSDYSPLKSGPLMAAQKFRWINSANHIVCRSLDSGSLSADASFPGILAPQAMWNSTAPTGITYRYSLYPVFPGDQLFCYLRDEILPNRSNRSVSEFFNHALDLSQLISAIHSLRRFHGNITPETVFVINGRLLLSECELSLPIQSKHGKELSGWFPTKHNTSSPDYSSGDVFMLGNLFYALLTGNLAISEPVDSDDLERIIGSITPQNVSFDDLIIDDHNPKIISCLLSLIQDMLRQQIPIANVVSDLEIYASSLIERR